MSNLLPKADMCSALGHVGFGPIAGIMPGQLLLLLLFLGQSDNKRTLMAHPFGLDAVVLCERFKSSSFFWISQFLGSPEKVEGHCKIIVPFGHL
jgi:hypothetical protein